MQNVVFKKSQILFLALLTFSLTPITSSVVDGASFRNVIIPFLILIIYIIFNYVSLTIKSYHLIAIFFWGMALLSTATSSYVDLNRNVITLLFFVILFILLTSVKITTSLFKKFLDFYIFIGVIISFVIIMSMVFDHPFTYYRYSLDIIGIHKNPNYVVSMTAIAFCLLLYKFLFLKTNNYLKIVYACALIIIALGCFATGTRAALLNILVCFFIQFLFFVVIKRKLLILFLSLTLIYVSSVFAKYILPEYTYNRLFGGELLTDESRTTMWSTVYEVFLKTPLLGLGIDGSNYYLAFLGMKIDLHNIILQILFDLGFIGFTLFVLLITLRITKVKMTDLPLILSLYTTLFIPLLFQNGVIGFALWWPIIFIRLILNFSENNGNGLREILGKGN